MSLLAPPLAVCRYGRASCCAAPIGVFWIAGLVSLVYGGLGGPLRSGSVAWSVVALGIGLWIAATSWALLTVQQVTDENGVRGRRGGGGRRCDALPETDPRLDESDPLEQVSRSPDER